MTLRGAALLVDFDETASLDNVAELLLRRFARNGWQALRERFLSRELSLRDYQEQAYAMIPATRDEMANYAAESARLRAGFSGLVRFCQESRVPLAVVSGGLDFYVSAVLHRHGLDHVPVFATTTTFGVGGMTLDYPYAAPGCSQWGNCKCAVLERFQDGGRRIVYVGDGRVDACPAGQAAFVFARSSLLLHCQANRIPHNAFESFHEVVKALNDAAHPLHARLNDPPRTLQVGKESAREG
ncbi:MAG: hypothetical protein EXR48_04695 [Dehalococcoidia bacterium]|nr:hypothetical protein [Dehalococcoidia bacterium]